MGDINKSRELGLSWVSRIYDTVTAFLDVAVQEIDEKPNAAEPIMPLGRTLTDASVFREVPLGLQGEKL